MAKALHQQILEYLNRTTGKTFTLEDYAKIYYLPTYMAVLMDPNEQDSIQSSEEQAIPQTLTQIKNKIATWILEDFIRTEVNKIAEKNKEFFRLKVEDEEKRRLDWMNEDIPTFILTRRDVKIPVYLKIVDYWKKSNGLILKKSEFENYYCDDAILIGVDVNSERFVLIDFASKIPMYDFVENHSFLKGPVYRLNLNTLGDTVHELDFLEMTNEFKFILPPLPAEAIEVLPDIKFKDLKVAIVGNKISYYDVRRRTMEEDMLNLTYSEFKKRIEKFKFDEYYKMNNYRSERVEKMRLVPFAYHYYSYLAKNGEIPNPYQFVEYYIKNYVDVFTKDEEAYGKIKKEFLGFCDDDEFKIVDLTGRLLRAYNSFNRELGLLLMLQKKIGKSYIIKYDSQDDMVEGIDLTVSRKGETIGIASFVNTRLANHWKYKKDYRYKTSRDIELKKVFDFRATFSGKGKNVEKCGDVMLYSEKSVESLGKKIVKELK